MPNESLSKLVARVLGRTSYDSNGNLAQILRLNPQIKDPDLVIPGLSVKIPKSLLPIKTPPVVVVSPPPPPPPTPEEIEVKAKIIEIKNPAFGPRTRTREVRTYGGYFEGNYGQTKANYAAANHSVGGVYRVAVGGYFKNFDFDMSLRKTMSGTSAVHFRPQWIQGSLGYGWRIPEFWGVKTLLAAKIGAGQFEDAVVAIQGFPYISKIQFFTVGFKSRFTFGNNWDLGGTLLKGLPRSGYNRLYVQSDLSYWIGSQLRIGVGYWYDHHSAIQGSENFYEEQIGLEGIAALYF